MCILCLNLIGSYWIWFLWKSASFLHYQAPGKVQLCLGTGLLIWHLPMAQTISNPKSLGRWWWFCGASFPKIHKNPGIIGLNPLANHYQTMEWRFYVLGDPSSQRNWCPSVKKPVDWHSAPKNAQPPAALARSKRCKVYLLRSSQHSQHFQVRTALRTAIASQRLGFFMKGVSIQPGIAKKTIE